MIESKSDSSNSKDYTPLPLWGGAGGEAIIAPIPKELLRAELTDDKRLRMTSRSANEVYVCTWQDSPNVVREIGRLREIAFRAAGGGTGKDCDLDEFDTMDDPYKQLIVWDPRREEIIGGYRYILGPDIKFNADGQPILATSHMFRFSDNFIHNYLPYTIELGRSFVTVEHQASVIEKPADGGNKQPAGDNKQAAGANQQAAGEGQQPQRKDSHSIFALDNLWDGLGALAVIMPGCKYFFGKMTMYPSYNRRGRDMILYFLRKHFGDKDQLVIPECPLQLEHDEAELAALFPHDTFTEDFKILNAEVRKLGYNIPPLVNAYMSLSPTMKMFGTAINDGFGDVEETGILIAVNEIYDQKRIRYIDNFAKEHPELVKITSGANKIFYEEAPPPAPPRNGRGV